MRAAIVFLILGCLSLASADKGKEGKGKPPARGEFASVGDLNAEVAVLNVLHILNPSPGQLEALREASARTMQPAPPRKLVQVSPTYKKTLIALRNALAVGDDEKIEELFETYHELQAKEEQETEEVEITAAARKEAPALLRLFSSRQVAIYLAGIENFPDPAEQLVAGMEQMRKLEGKARQQLRDDIAFQAGWIIAGLENAVEEKIRERAIALLDRAAKMDDKTFEAQRLPLEKDVRGLLGKVGPTDILCHYMQRVLAETLSNHRLAAALDSRGVKRGK